MIKSWLVAGALCFIAAVAREIVGFNTVLAAASASNLDQTSVTFYHIAWHTLTGVCVLSGSMFIFIGMRPNRLASAQIAWLLSSIFALLAVIVVIVSTIFGWATDMAPPIVLSVAIALSGSIGAMKLVGEISDT